MSDWKRSTREVSFEELVPEMRSAVNAHVERYNLGPVLSDVLMCIQTDSEKAKKGLFGKQENMTQGVVVTPRWLIWVVASAATPAAVLSTQLSNVVVQDYAQTPFAKMVPDTGVQVSGIFTDSSESASAFIGLDEGGAARKFRDVLIKAIQDSKM